MQIEPLRQVQLLQLDELPVLLVRNRQGEALIALQGAQVLRYGQPEQPPIIWLSEQAEFKRGRSVRGGIPVCWPWFGDLQKNPCAVRSQVAEGTEQPAHGLVRGQDWILESVTEAPELCTLVLRYPAPLGLAPHWHGQVDLRLQIEVGHRLHLRLSTTNHGSHPLPLSQALHSYFAVGDIHAARIQGLAEVTYLDTLDQWHCKTHPGDLAITGEVDRIYLNTPKQIRIQDPAWGRRLHIQAQNSNSAVVWNPWTEKSQRLSQLAPDAWQRMLCIETANVMDDMVNLAPGANHHLELTCWNEPLGD